MPPKLIRRATVLWLQLISLSGCAIGYNSTLFVTKSNIGVDIDSKPPTAEISLARREGVIGPTFEGGQKPPVMASFRYNIKGIFGLFSNVSSTFAGGDAAATMSKLFGGGDATQAENSAVCLSKKPQLTVFGREISFPGEGDVRPFVFGTDTTVGLKIAWSGLTAQIPDTVRFGYNRKEFSLAPVFGAAQRCGDNGTYVVKIPSFLATVDSSTTVKDPAGSGLDHLQYFATGIAATNLALRQDVRRVMLKRLDPASAIEEEYGSDNNSKCIETWLDADKNNIEKLKQWLTAKKVSSGITLLLNGKGQAVLRKQAVDDAALGVTCK